MTLLNRLFVAFILSVSFFTPAFSQQNNAHELAFRIQHAPQKLVRIGYLEDNRVVFTDSAYTNADGEVVLKGNKTLPQGMYIAEIGGKNMDFFVSEQSFSIVSDLQNLDLTAKSIGSQENELYFAYKVFIINKKKQARLLKEQSKQNKDPRLKTEIEAINKQVAMYRDSLFKNFPTSLAVKTIKLGLDTKPRYTDNAQRQVDQVYMRRTVAEQIDFSDERLIRTPYLEEKILKLLQFTSLQPDSLAKTADEILAKTTVNPTMYAYVLRTLMKNTATSKMPWMDVLYTYLAKKYYMTGKPLSVDTSDMLNVKANIMRFDPLLTGKIAPAIDFMDTLWKAIPLYSIKAKYTILYFWDADCEHCLETTPKLWELYKKYRHRGIEVYAVTTQQVYYTWQEYQRKHKIDWINVMDPVNIPEVYNTYQIATTPSIFLLDEDKRFLAKKISLKELENYLQMLIGH
jgi:thiol-disulfide isomerase/thioredoxin